MARQGARAGAGAGAGHRRMAAVHRRGRALRPGRPWLRFEVIDDIGLAQMLNRGGVRGALLGGAGVVAVAWYPTLGAMVRGLEKGAFAAMRYRVPATAAVVALTLLGCAGWLAS